MDEENKQLLLELIGEQYIKYHIGDNNGFIGFYNNIYKFYQRNQGEYASIQEINKKIIQESVGFIDKNVMPPNDVREDYNNKQLKEAATSLKQVDKTDLRYVADDKFDMKLKKREKDFSGLMDKGKPEKIDFSFKTDDELPADDLNKLLGQTLEDRANELENITNKYNTGGLEDAAKWLKINEENKGGDKPKKEKTVTFKIEDDDTTVTSLLSKLKPSMRAEDSDMMKLLNTILNNQNEILDLLKGGGMEKIV